MDIKLSGKRRMVGDKAKARHRFDCQSLPYHSAMDIYFWVIPSQVSLFNKSTSFWGIQRLSCRSQAKPFIGMCRVWVTQVCWVNPLLPTNRAKTVANTSVQSARVYQQTRARKVKFEEYWSTVNNQEFGTRSL